MRQAEIIKILNKTKNVHSLCGQHIGSGLYRDVYVLKQDHRWVVKVERDMTTGVFANVTEWRNWIMNKEFTRVSKFLAPCVSINEYGNVLIQRRVRRVIDGDKRLFPARIPNWLTDTKINNFGWIGNQFVCCDYSFLVNCAFKMKRAKYWIH